MKNILFLSLLGVALFTFSAALAEDTPAQINRVMTEAGFTEQQIVQVRSMISAAERKGLPAEAVTDKIHEGIAKRVDPERIVQAAERVTSRYEYGYALAEKLATDKQQVAQIGKAMADGLAAGLTKKDAERIIEQLQAGKEEMDRSQLQSLAQEAVRTARDLSRRGVSSKTTAETVTTAVQKGFSATEMHTMRTSFARQASHGNVESIAKSYEAAIGRGIRAQDLSGHGAGGKGAGIGGGGIGADISGTDSGHAGGDSGGDSGNSGGSGGSDGSGGGGSGSGGSGGSDGSGGGGSGSGGGGGGRH